MFWTANADAACPEDMQVSDPAFQRGDTLFEHVVAVDSGFEVDVPEFAKTEKVTACSVLLNW